MRRIAVLLGVSLMALAGAPAFAAEVRAAVAANFTRPAEEIGAAFTAKTGDTVTFSFGATGALYTQISQGAPFEVFFSADNKRPKQAVTEGFAVDGTVFSYAVGKVVLYSPLLDLTDGAAVAPKIVTGENISQALQFVDTANAELGFVSLSQVIDKPGREVWRVPAENYSPILQDAVLLKAGEADPAAAAFLEFLKGDEARAIIEKYGYELAR